METYKTEIPEKKNTLQYKLLENKSEEVQEILGKVPNWTIRWGITLISSIIFLLLLSSWFIKYPDIVASRIVLTTKTPPATMIARAEGRLHLLVKDNEKVKPGDYLGVLENPARTEDVKYLSNQIKLFKDHLNQPLKNSSAIIFNKSLVLGELQTSYESFLSSLEDYTRSKLLLSHDKQLSSLQTRVVQYEHLNQQLEKQQELLAEELELSQKRFSIDKKLFTEKVIAEMDFDRSKNTYLQSKRAFESAQNNIINNDIIISQLKGQITDLQIDKVDTEEKLRTTVESNLKILESQLETWEQKYNFKTPIEGKVSLSKYWTDNQFIKMGEEVMTVVPVSDKVFAQVLLPIAGSGKVEIGQRVNIRFDNYPAHEYGIVTGYIQSISPVPANEMYTIEISLPKGLTTSYKKTLGFRQQMQGSAEIITKDLRLIERIFNQLRALTDRAG